jgi:hypothetical protein
LASKTLTISFSNSALRRRASDLLSVPLHGISWERGWI